jgi:dihydroneopterin triphosphate diphosphatase
MSRQYRVPIQVLVYCYRLNNSCIEFLLLKRTARYGGFWQGVTGAPEGDESLLNAALRELREETMFSPVNIRQVDFRYTFPVSDEWRAAYHPDIQHIDEFVFLAEIAASREPVLSFEHKEYLWTSFDEAVSLLKYEDNRRALEFCDHLLKL